MRVIIDCDQALYPAAAALLDQELLGWRDRYKRVGWGWATSRDRARFFVKRIKNGLSVTQIAPARVSP